MPGLPNNSGGAIAIGTTLPLFGSGRRGSMPWVNSWLIFLLIFGTIIVLADGFSRDALPDEGTVSATPVLEYESFWSALVFACVSLPLCYFYARKTGASRPESMLFWFVLNTVAYAKDFAYIRVPGLPLFITDVVLALFLLSFFRKMRFRFLLSDRWWGRLVLGFIAIGAISVVRGVRGNQDLTLVARDAAIVVYSLFLFVGFHVVKTWDGVRRISVAMVSGAVFATINGLAWFLAEPDQRRFILYGVFILTSFVGTLVFTINRMIRPALGWSLALVLLVGILLINARTIFLGVGFGVMVMMLASTSGKFRVSMRSVRLAAGVLVVLVLVLWAASQTRSGQAFVDRAETELVSGTVNYSDDANATFRLMAWFEALRRFSASPALGEAYGIPFTFDLDATDARPHNTYLTVLYKMGVLGLVPLLWLLAGFHWRGWKSLRRLSSTSQATIMYGLMLGQLLMCLFGVLNLLLESPFLASIFWLTIGIGLRLIYLPETASRPRLATS